MGMKQFKKWWTRHNPTGHIESAGFNMDSDVWKAALEWVLLTGSDDDVLFRKIKDELYGE